MDGHKLERLVGDNPPHHVPTFILTHYARRSIEMEGGTTSISLKEAFAKRSTAHAMLLLETMSGSAVGRTQASNIFVRASSMSCTLPSRRSCSAGENRCSKGLTSPIGPCTRLIVENAQRGNRPFRSSRSLDWRSLHLVHLTAKHYMEKRAARTAIV